ncbi:MAG TPA: FAD-dependent oxidoreductase [Sulfolobales archaeon]|nr:FAD-dependent oxidoreductase [Sulfolobales archaeon]
MEHEYGVTIIGAGILGASLAFWLSEKLDARIAIIDREEKPALHASGRNTGVIHRPFHLDPARRKISAIASNASYAFWKEFSSRYSLPWKQVGTLKVALEDRDLAVLEKYLRWGEENGMDREEMELLSGSEVLEIEPEVRCPGALLIKSEASVDFALYTEKLVELSISNGVRFLGGLRVTRISEKGEGVEILATNGSKTSRIRSRVLINAAGGGSLDLARQLDLGREYAVLFFRGDYWRVSRDSGLRIRRNIYSVPRHASFPFLDPHFIVRHDGSNDVGPNAVPVLGPYTYKGFSDSFAKSIKTVFGKPLYPKLRLVFNMEFLSLAYSEWMSTLSKKAMASRVARFIPRLKHQMLVERIPGGVRSQVISSGGIVHDPVILLGGRSIHITNYNSPGATGAPGFAAYIYRLAEEKGFIEGFKKRRSAHGDLIDIVEKRLDLL